MKRHIYTGILVITCASLIVCSCGKKISPGALKYYTAGEKDYQLMLYDDAIKQFDEAIKVQPSLSLAYLGIGKSLAETGKFDDALKQYKTALDLDPRNEEIFLEIGRAYIEKNLDEEGLVMLKKAEDLDSDNPKLYLYRGMYDAKIMQYGKAVDEYLKAADEDDSWPEPYIRLAFLYINATNPSFNDSKKAVEYAKKAVEINPKSLKALDALANAYFADGQYDVAIQTEMKALEISPNNPVILRNLALLQGTVKGTADEHNLKGADLLEKGDMVGAAAEFKNAVTIDPKYSDGYYNLGKVYSQLKDYPLAEENYKKAIDIDPENSRYHYNLAIVYGNTDKPKDAEREYLAAIGVDPNYDKAHNNLGALYVKMEKYNEALAEFNKAFEISPSSDYKSNGEMVKKIMEEKGIAPKTITPDKKQNQY